MQVKAQPRRPASKSVSQENSLLAILCHKKLADGGQRMLQAEQCSPRGRKIGIQQTGSTAPPPQIHLQTKQPKNTKAVLLLLSSEACRKQSAPAKHLHGDDSEAAKSELDL